MTRRSSPLRDRSDRSDRSVAAAADSGTRPLYVEDLVRRIDDRSLLADRVTAKRIAAAAIATIEHPLSAEEEDIAERWQRIGSAANKLLDAIRAGDDLLAPRFLGERRASQAEHLGKIVRHAEFADGAFRIQFVSNVARRLGLTEGTAETLERELIRMRGSDVRLKIERIFVGEDEDGRPASSDLLGELDRWYGIYDEARAFVPDPETRSERTPTPREPHE